MFNLNPGRAKMSGVQARKHRGEQNKQTKNDWKKKKQNETRKKSKSEAKSRREGNRQQKNYNNECNQDLGSHWCVAVVHYQSLRATERQNLIWKQIKFNTHFPQLIQNLYFLFLLLLFSLYNFQSATRLAEENSMSCTATFSVNWNLSIKYTWVQLVSW